MKKQKNFIKRQKSAYQYILQQAGTIGYIMKLAGVMLGVGYLLLGGIILFFFWGSEIGVIAALLMGFLSFLSFRKYWKTRLFNRNDVFKGQDYLKWYETQFKKKGGKNGKRKKTNVG